MAQINQFCHRPALLGLSIFAHAQFLDSFEFLIVQIERLRTKDPKGYTVKNSTKRLAAIVKLAFEIIPQDPTRPQYRQGATLGDEYKHWFRAKFFQQYRLFFRYHRESRIIIYPWVNDEDAKRAYESGSEQAKAQNKRMRAAKDSAR
jgi:toxin YhaV